MRRLDRRLGLHLVEGCRNRDDGAGYVDPAEFGLNLPQQRLDDLGARFLGRNALAGGGQIEMARSAHKALEALGNVSRSKLRLCMGPATYQHVTAPIKVDHAWQDIPPVISLEQAETLTVATDDRRRSRASSQRCRFGSGIARVFRQMGRPRCTIRGRRQPCTACPLA